VIGALDERSRHEPRRLDRPCHFAAARGVFAREAAVNLVHNARGIRLYVVLIQAATVTPPEPVKPEGKKP
jgi:hypothetical protein